MLARIHSVPLLEAGNLSPNAWYPVLDLAPAAFPQFVRITIDGQPQLIWSDHLEFSESPTREPQAPI